MNTVPFTTMGLCQCNEPRVVSCQRLAPVSGSYAPTRSPDASYNTLFARTAEVLRVVLLHCRTRLGLPAPSTTSFKVDVPLSLVMNTHVDASRSEERRVGKEGSGGGSLV